jgi:soluble calcium-activated nucleotidase 1
MLITDVEFSDVEVRHVGTVTPTHGFSSLKFIQGTNDEWIVALKSEETNGKTSTYALIFNMDGHIILPETQVSADHKF